MTASPSTRTDPLLRRVPGQAPRPVFSHAAGVRLFAPDGTVYLDAASGSMTTALGYTNPDIVEAMTRAASTLPYLHEAIGESPAAVDLARLLVSLAPEGITHTSFTSNGANAVEAAIRLAVLAQQGRGLPERRRVVGLGLSYHGSTPGALTCTGASAALEPFEGLLLHRLSVPTPFCPHRQADPHGEDDCATRAVEALEALLVGPEGGTVAAVVVEPIAAHAAGCRRVPAEFVAALHDLRRRHRFLVIADEVTTALGRVGPPFASTLVGLRPDLVCVGKGLGVGYSPISATLASGEVVAALPPGANLLGHNYNSHPIGVAVALTAVRRLTEPGLRDHVRDLGVDLARELAGLRDCPAVRDVRSEGLLAAVELRVPGPSTGTAGTWARTVADLALDAGVVVLPGACLVHGVPAAHLTVAPPLVTAPDDLREMLRRLRTALDTAADLLEGRR
ncbi:aspartate aminotransferase family protein [Umezawaea endophytica]|uniref:Aminotransferase class III-fold pyridoxal phosphate-dependent enzyme n=1 Tax=Umezawaea endophytica TaxID=1654476 RepID=A0A9X3A3P1_9PSEU|nr:aminotransferase class III-fold pyridoxal phosphate-dependent enzyme [Umezawaea endophytica]MCS7480343.1 aminotransferase class III-fold pyridoxal phosphate-dependent enzyme [Umezawaea endophytica]